MEGAARPNQRAAVALLPLPPAFLQLTGPRPARPAGVMYRVQHKTIDATDAGTLLTVPTQC